MARAAPRQIPDYFLYGESPRPVPERYVHVEMIEARSARHHWKIEPHLHRSLHQILLVSRGRGVVKAEGAVTHFRPPALNVAPAGSVHGYEFEPGTLGFVITLSDELLRDLAAREPALAGLFAAPATLEMPESAAATGPLLRCARALAREYTLAVPGRALALEGQLAVLLAQILRISRSIAQASSGSQSSQRQLVTRFRKLIEAGFRSGRAVPEYATALRVSEARLRNACLSAAGQPPIQLIHARILIEAKRQLVYTALPVAEIGYGLGFDDPAYFTRFFTRRAGVSPRGYRMRPPISGA